MSTGHTVTYTKYGHTLKSTLYGTVTEDRIAKAKAELAHRAEQLYAPVAEEPVRPAYRKPRRTDDPLMESDWEFEDDEDDFGDDEDDTLGG